MSLERVIRELLVFKGDVNAVRRGRVGRWHGGFTGRDGPVGPKAVG
jgi:hypothetical protein